MDGYGAGSGVDPITPSASPAIPMQPVHCNFVCVKRNPVTVIIHLKDP